MYSRYVQQVCTAGICSRYLRQISTAGISSRYVQQVSAAGIDSRYVPNDDPDTSPEPSHGTPNAAADADTYKRSDGAAIAMAEP